MIITGTGNEVERSFSFDPADEEEEIDCFDEGCLTQKNKVFEMLGCNNASRDRLEPQIPSFRLSFEPDSRKKDSLK